MDYKCRQGLPESRPSMNSMIYNPQFYASSISCGSSNLEQFPTEYNRNCIESTADVCSSMDFSDFSFSMLPGAVIDTSVGGMLHPKEHTQNINWPMDRPPSFSSMLSTGAMNPSLNHFLLGENIPLVQKTHVYSSFVEIDNCVVPCRSEGMIDASTMPNWETTSSVYQVSDSVVASCNEYTQFDSVRSLSELRIFDSILQWISSTPDRCIGICAPKPSGSLSPVMDGALLSDLQNVDCPDGIPIDFDKSDESFSLTRANVELSDVYGMSCDPKMMCSSSQDVNISKMSGCCTGNGISSISGYVSDTNAGKRAGPNKGLFSELGLDRLLHPISKSVSDEYSSGTKRTDSSLHVQQPIKAFSAGISCIKDILISKIAASNVEKLSHGKVSTKSQANLWMDNAESSVIVQSTSGEAHTKVSKKRCRSGESPRPRPKDRQMIQDRIKELRELIPNGGKLSIDALLHSTIKHVLFLQEVVNHANVLKLMGHKNGVIHGENTANDISSTSGATWGLEVGDKTSVCPIIVEDLKSPGHMFIEILCEEGVYFFEIAGLIRSYGLTILNGMMEIRQGVIWAHFIVKVSGGVRRMDVFMFLVDFLQKTASRRNDLTDSNVGMRSSLPSSYQQTARPVSVNTCCR